MLRKLSLFGLLSLALVLGACAKNRGAEPEAEAEMSTADYPSQQVTLKTPIEFADSAEVRDAVLDECRLQDKLQQFITEFSAARNIEIVPSNGPVNGTSGKVLDVRITDIYAPGGGAFSGGKAVTIEADLTENGASLGSLRARRISGGGAFAVFKGTCDILGRDVRTLGEDISKFLTDPSENARMGNL
ncbi:hypothetical protein [Halofilum ochraceum]|uniref:hypothetical protein n=1 Tax=Halofilum ochraceum TaxID=1611323 RepID=UPI0008339DBB|nr:hypothetical protein [Halofilum ochraceum]